MATGSTRRQLHTADSTRTRVRARLKSPIALVPIVRRSDPSRMSVPGPKKEFLWRTGLRVVELDSSRPERMGGVPLTIGKLRKGTDFVSERREHGEHHSKKAKRRTGPSAR